MWDFGEILNMDQFCDTPFWDANRTWNNSWPEFTDCFQNVALLGAPCLLLWVVSSIRAFFLIDSADDVLPVSGLYRKKMLVSYLLAFVTLLDLSLRLFNEGLYTEIPPLRAELLAQAVFFASVMLSMSIVRMERQKGVLTSVVLFWFWLCLAVTQAVPFYTIIITETYLARPVESVLFNAKYALTVSSFLLHCFAEQQTPEALKKVTRRNFNYGVSVLTTLVECGIQDFIDKGYNGKITSDDMGDLWDSEKSRNVLPRFTPTWEKDVASAREKNRKYEAEHPEEYSRPSFVRSDSVDAKKEQNGAELKRSKSVTEEKSNSKELSTDPESNGRNYRRISSVEEKSNPKDYKRSVSSEERKKSPKHSKKESGKEGEKKEKTKPQPKYVPSVLVALLKTYWFDVLITHSMRSLAVALNLAKPVILGWLLTFMDDKEAPVWRGYFLCVLMFLCNMLQDRLIHNFNYNNHRLALRLQDSLAGSIFKKALTMDTEARQESTVGQAVNLLSDDIHEIRHTITWMAAEMWVVPVKIVFCLVMLYGVLGPSMLYGVALLAILVPVNVVLVRKLTKMHKERMDLKDERLKALTEVINGIKILKMYAWEPSFFTKVNDVRVKELDNSWRATAFETFMHCYYCITPYAVSVVVFLAYIFASEDHYLSPSKAFVALTLIDILRHAMNCMPHIVNHGIKSMVSIKRVNEFLFRGDLDNDIVRDSGRKNAVEIKEGYFTWNSDCTPTLKNINVNIKRGSLVAVVGTVGSGKSSLVSACLGEMKRLHGQVSIQGSVAYVSQQAWIQHATLRDNVLFGTEMDRERYEKCLDDCCLRPDLEILPGGDSTEIGEKGINLSGGQKQRVSLARAVYSDADVYLLDDPLSAVDCHVGSHIFNKVIGHEGMLAGKTRVLVTHGVQWLPKVDQVIVMRHGRVSEVGTYEELLSHNGPFAKFLKKQFAHEHQADPDPQVRKMKFRILSRLDSIPKDSEAEKTKRSVSNDDNDNDDDSTKETNSSSSSSDDSGDNEAIIQELFRTMSQDDTIKEDNVEQAFEEGTDFEEAKKEANKRGDKEKEKDGKLVDDEDDELQEVDLRSTLAEMARNFCYTWVGLYVVLNLTRETAQRYGSVTLSQWTDDTQLGNLTALPAESVERTDINNHYLTLYVGFGVIHAVLTLVTRLILLTRMVIVARRQHCKILDRVLKAPLSFFDTTPVGRIVSRFSSHLNKVDQDLPHTAVSYLESITGLIIKVALVVYTIPVYIVFLIPISYVYFHTQRYYYPTMRHLERMSSKFRAPIMSYFSETLGGTATVRAYGAQDRFLEEFQRRVDIHEMVHWNWHHCNRWLAVRLNGLGFLTAFCVTLTAVYMRDTMSAGAVGLAVSIAMDLSGTLHRLIHELSWLQTELPSVERVKEYAEMKIEAAWRKDTKPPEAWPQSGEVKFDKLAVRYREGMDLVLKGINMKIAAGEKVGIVGRTGAGKSSLTLALFRLIEPAQGHVVIDDVNTSDLGLHDLRARLTILPQDPVIFAGSLRMNLDPFSRYKDSDVWEALRHAHLSDFVEGLEKGLEHECGEGGENLSVGQRQLLCLARTLLHKTRVLVLDEATAAVDMETDDLIQRTIRSEFSDCTVLTIAHRLNTVIDYDKILVLDKGEVKEFDTPVRLMQDASSVFHSMAKSAGLLPKLPELIEKQRQKEAAAA